MALNPEARRQEGVRAIGAEFFRGSPGKNGEGIDLPTATYTNPGSTPNLRGIEANTGKSEGSNIGEPMIQTVTAGEAPPRSEVFHAPDASAMTTQDGFPKWDSTDRDPKNERVTKIPMDSFSAMGESYPANGGLDGRT